MGNHNSKKKDTLITENECRPKKSNLLTVNGLSYFYYFIDRIFILLIDPSIIASNCHLDPKGKIYFEKIK
jgi:hypothetical protein